MMSKTSIGLIVNPIAGMGGSVGLKGTDGAEILRKAKELGAVPHSPERAIEALEALSPIQDRFILYTYGGELGEEEALAAGLSPCVVGSSKRGETTAGDTRSACRDFLFQGVEIILFAGGDGTAHDVLEAVEQSVPVIGIPAGVKMHSAAYATNPRSAGSLAYHFLTQGNQSFRDLEVMDFDEPAFREGRVSARILGYLRVPFIEALVQGPKLSFRSERQTLASIAAAVTERMDEDNLFIIGPGTTTGAIMSFLNLKGSLSGVDVVRHKRLLLSDANEWQLVELVERLPSRIVVTPIGGQGHIFGRGNQQISSRVIDRVGTENMIIVATPEKLASFRGRPLQVDLLDPRIHDCLRGYQSIITGKDERVIYPIA